MRGEDAAGAVRERDLGALDLAVAALAAQLAHRLDEQQHAELAGVAVREPAAGGVERERAARARSGRPSRTRRPRRGRRSRGPRARAAR